MSREDEPMYMIAARDAVKRGEMTAPTIVRMLLDRIERVEAGR